MAKAVPVLLALLGTANLGLALRSTLSAGSSFPSASFCLPFAAGIAAITSAWLVRRGWGRFAFWFALGLLGQAVALQLIDAGKQVRYQHYRTFDRLVSDTHPGLLMYLGVQLLLVLLAFRHFGPELRAWVRRSLQGWQLALIVMSFVLTSAVVSQSLSIYAGELIFAAFIQAVNVMNLVVMVAALPDDAVSSFGRRIDRLLIREEAASSPFPLDVFAAATAAWVVALCALMSVLAYQRHPHIADEVAYLNHARYFAEGVLTMPAPPVREAFAMYLMHFEGDHWHPSPPPGWPVILSLGVHAGAPWIVNPVLAGLNLLLLYALVGHLYDVRTARAIALLLSVSPWFVFMGMNFMTHQVTLTCTLAALLGVARARWSGQTRWAWIAGAALGVGSLVRPLDGLLVAVATGLWAIGIGGKRLPIRDVAALVLGSMLVGALVLPYNQELTGSPFRFPIMAYTDEHFAPNANAYGFGPDRGMGWPIDPYPGHGPVDAVVNASLNTTSINSDLFGWSTGSLAFILLAVFAWHVRRQDALMLLIIVLNFALYFFYYFSGGPDFGARYWFLMVLPCAVLTLRGIEWLQASLAKRKADVARVSLAVGCLCSFALVNYFPWRAIDKYYHYLGMRPDVSYLAREHGFGKSLVLVRGDELPDYVSAATFNPLDFEEPVPVYARYGTPEMRKRLVEAFPDRSFWIIDGPTVTGSGYRVVAGPIPPEELSRYP